MENLKHCSRKPHHEDALYSLDCVEELRGAIDKFNEDNKANGSYFDDINTIVELF